MKLFDPNIVLLQLLEFAICLKNLLATTIRICHLSEKSFMVIILFNYLVVFFISSMSINY